MTNTSQPVAPLDEREAAISPDIPLQEVIGRANRLLGDGGHAMPGRFGFQWQNIDFTVTPADPDASAGSVTIEACLGHLPFTAQDAAARNSALDLTGSPAGELPGRMTIDKSGVVRLVMEIEPTATVGLASLLKEVTYKVLKSADRLKQLRGLLVD